MATYSPSQHTTSNKPYGISGKPVDARYWYYDEITFIYRPYTDIDEVLAYLNLSDFRKGAIVQVGEDEYWWPNENDLSDAGLGLKVPLNSVKYDDGTNEFFYWDGAEYKQNTVIPQILDDIDTINDDISDLQTEITGIAGGWKGNVKIADPAPTVPGIYTPTESGTYTNLLDSGGNPLVIDLTLGATTITRDANGVWTKIPPATSAVSPAEFEETITGINDILTPISTVIKPDAVLSEGIASATTDSNGNIVMQVQSDGTHEFLKAIVHDLQALGTPEFADALFQQISMSDVTFVTNNSYVFSITDDNLNIIFAIKNDFTIIGNIEQGASATLKQFADYNTIADIVHYVTYGQSLSLGGQGTPAISTTASYNSLKFVGGVRAQDAGTDVTLKYGSLVPLIESDYDNAGETPCSGFSALINQTILRETESEAEDFNFALLCSSPGETGRSIAQLSKGTSLYTRMLSDVTYGKTRANALNKSYVAPVVSWTQGEQDKAIGTTKAAYISAFTQLRSDIDADIKAITNQTQDVIFPMYQMASFGATISDITLAHAEICESGTIPNVYMAVPAYIFDYKVGDNVHLAPKSYRHLGGYYAMVYKKVVLDGVGWKHLKLLKTTVINNVIELLYDVPVAPLVFDTVFINDPGNYGYKVRNLSNTDVATSVTIVRGNTVKITCSENIQDGYILSYAVLGTGTSGRSGNRGCLRDSQGDSEYMVINGETIRFHNWGLILYQTIDV